MARKLRDDASVFTKITQRSAYAGLVKMNPIAHSSGVAHRNRGAALKHVAQSICHQIDQNLPGAIRVSKDRGEATQGNRGLNGKLPSVPE